MTKDEMTIVSAIRNRLADEIGQDKFDIWFDQSVTWNLSGTTLCLYAPNSFNAERLKRVYQSKLKNVLSFLSQSHLDLSFKVATEQPAEPSSLEATTQSPPSFAQEISLTPATQVIPTHHPNAGLPNLVVGQSNHIAVSAAKSMLEPTSTAARSASPNSASNAAAC